jgi:hypothetical protein
MWCVLLAALLGAVSSQASAETVMVKYRGALDLSNLQCQWVARSSLIQRLCYDSQNEYVVVNLNGTYYHYCRVPAGVVSAGAAAPSMGQYFNASVKGRYDCRLNPPPPYG